MARVKKRKLRAAQMQPEERRWQLLRAGVACFAAEGIGGTRHADIARVCEVSVSTVFAHFPNRTALVASILTEVAEKIWQETFLPAQQLPVFEDRLPATAPLFSQLAEREPDYVKVWLMWGTHFAPDIQALYIEHEQRFLDALADMFHEGAADDDPGEDMHDRARMIIAASGFLAKLVFDGVSEQRRTEFAQHVLEPLLKFSD